MRSTRIRPVLLSHGYDAWQFRQILARGVHGSGATARNIGRFRLPVVTLAGLGHLAHEEAPERAAAVIAQVLR